MRRILICTTVLSTVKAFLVPHIRLLRELGYSVDIAGNNDITGLETIVESIYDIPFQRNPFSKMNLIASRKLKEITSTKRYELIHFHTPVASAFGRWIVKDLRKKGTKVIYTAHGFHFFKGAPKKNWLLFYPVEFLLARYTDVLITINKEDYIRAKKLFKSKSVIYVPGVGLDTKRFNEALIDKTIKREELGIPGDSFVILSVGELNENKNHEIVIKLLPKLNNQKVFYIICGKGEKESFLRQLAVSIGVADRVKLLGFREDISEIYKVADIFAFPSFREGLSVSIMEAMASGLPVVCSNIRGNTDLIVDGEGGMLVEPDNIDKFAQAIDKLISNQSIRNRMKQFNVEAAKQFDFDNVISSMVSIYTVSGQSLTGNTGTV